MEQDVLSLLMNKELPENERRELKHKRLSKALGADVIITIKGLSFDRVMDLNKLQDDQFACHAVLEGVVSPNLKDSSLMEKFKVHTPIDLIKTIFKAGEIDALAKEIERLSGFRTTVFEEVKKN